MKLDRSVPSCRQLPIVYVSLMCVELDKTWTFVEPHGGSAKRPTSENRSLAKTSSSSSNKHAMIGSSTTTYHLTHSARLDLLPPSNLATSDFESADPYIADCSSDGGSSPYERLVRRLWRLRTTTFVRVPGDASFTSIAMSHLHQLHTARSIRENLPR